MMASYQQNALFAHEVSLIREILTGRRDLFGDLVAPHLTVLFRILQRRFGPHPDIEDIVQQAMLKALVHLHQFRAESSFQTWLVRIGLNEARQWQRGKATSRVVPLEPAASHAIRDQRMLPSAECQRNEIIARVRSAAARLPEKYRSVFRLLEIEEISVAETARRLRLNISTVKTRRMRARRRIANVLNRKRLLPNLPDSKCYR